MYSYIDNHYTDSKLLFSLQLTSEGYQNMNEIVSSIVSYVEFIKLQGVQDFIVEEMKRKNDLDWNMFEPCHISCSGFIF